MRRMPLWLAGAALAGALAAAPLLAQDAWPDFASGSPDLHFLPRGPGFYFPIYKLLLLVGVFLLWVKSADWVARDSETIGEETGLPHTIWSPVVIFSFLFAFMILALGIPIFAAGFLLAVAAYAIPFGIYVVQRNAKVGEEKRVLTPKHIVHVLKNLGKGKAAAAEEVVVKQPWEQGPAVEMTGVGPLQMQIQANLIEARQSPAFVPTKIVIADALENRAEKILFDYTAQAVAIKYMVDGVLHNAAPQIDPKTPLDRQLGDLILAVLKKLAGLNPADRRSKQEGKLRVEYQGNKYDTVLQSQGTQTGERAVLSFTLVTKTIRSLEDLGMREKMRGLLKETLSVPSGLIIVSSMPGDGLSATWGAMLKSTDRLLRDFVSLQEATKQELDVENIEIVRYKSAEGQTPESLLPGVFLKEPNVICLPEVQSGQALSMVIDAAANDGKLAIVSVRAREAVEALLRVMALQPRNEKFPQVVTAVLNQRLIRKLCDLCREAVPLTPELSQRLGIPPGRVQVIYREKQPPPPGAQPKKGEPEICPKCRGIGYHGRTAVYELLIVTDKLRQALATQPKLEVLRQVAKQGGHPSLQEEGVLLMATGATSLAELQRVLKA